MMRSRLFLIMGLLCVLQFAWGGTTKPDPENWTDGGDDYKSTAYDVKWYEESESEYTISTSAELGGLAKLVNDGNDFEGKTISLDDDLDMSEYYWVSIEKFKGVFDGNSHTISNLTTNNTSVGLFNEVDNGEVKNVMVEGAAKKSGALAVGGVIAKLTGGKVSNVGFSGKVEAAGEGALAGGVVGENHEGTIENTFFYGQGSVKELAAFSGIVASSTGTVSHSYYYLQEEQEEERDFAWNFNSADYFVNETEGPDTLTAGRYPFLNDASIYVAPNQLAVIDITKTVAAGSPAEIATTGALILEGDESAVILSEIRAGDKIRIAFGALNNVVTGEEEEGVVGIHVTDNDGEIFTSFYCEDGDVPYYARAFEYTAENDDLIILMNEGDVVIYNIILEAREEDKGLVGEEHGVAMEETTFTSGEVAWLLNQGEEGHIAAWAQGELYPVLANEENLPIRKIFYPEETSEYGSIEGPVYVAETTQVDFNITVEEGYMIENIEVEGAELINYSYLIMPANDVTIKYEVNAIPIDAITAFPAEDVTTTSFVARWNEVARASEYYITVKEGDNILEGYNKKATGIVSSLLIDNLQPQTTYSYYLQSVVGGVESEPSNVITVTTNAKSLEIKSIEKTSFIAQWVPLLDVEKYVLILTQQGEEVDKVETTETSYLFDGLLLNTEYVLSFTIEYLDGETERWDPVTVKTKGDYGQQLNNAGFEQWEGTGDNEKPGDWNSFMTAGGSWAAFVKTKQMQKSTEVRPGSSGQYSTNIWTLDKSLSLANGNLTCGRIMAVSTSVSTGLNHNKSIVDDPEFSEYIGNARPDSISVWVKFVPKKDSDMARIAATIHDRYDYCDPTTYDPASADHVVAKAELNYLPAKDEDGKYVWQRITIPFDYDKYEFDSNDNYMLVTFTTNETPGGGSENDSVYIDDILLIYKPVLKVNSDAKTSFSIGDQISIDYTLEGTMSATNILADRNTVTLEISDNTGSFASPLVLTTVATDYSGTLVADIPESYGMGNYKVRIVTTNYPMVSEEFAIQIGPKAPVALPAQEVQEGSFVAVWEEHEEATEYLLTVKLRNQVVEGYDDLLVTDVTSQLVSGLGQGRNYTYTVKARLDGYVSGESNEIAVRTLGDNFEPDPVEAFEATDITETTFIASWSESSLATEYLLTVKEDGVALADYDGVSTGLETSVVVTGLEPNTTYTYSVIARNGQIDSEESNVITVTTDRLSEIENSVVTNFSVYPVPAKETLYVTGVEGNELYAIFSISGNMVVTDYLINGEIDVRNLASGVYVIRIAGVQTKFIKE